MDACFLEIQHVYIWRALYINWITYASLYQSRNEFDSEKWISKWTQNEQITAKSTHAHQVHANEWFFNGFSAFSVEWCATICRANHHHQQQWSRTKNKRHSSYSKSTSLILEYLFLNCTTMFNTMGYKMYAMYTTRSEGRKKRTELSISLSEWIESTKHSHALCTPEKVLQRRHRSGNSSFVGFETCWLMF